MKKILKTLVLVFLAVLLMMSIASCKNFWNGKDNNEPTTTASTEQTDPVEIPTETTPVNPDQPNPHEHSYKTAVTNPTCETAGYTTYTCTCGDSYVADEVAALGHEAGAAATCEAAQTCTRCDYVFQAALGHEAGAAATCTAPQICTVCKVELTPALGHSWANANCTTPKTCSVCGATEGAALGHTAGAAATCTAPQTCTVCSAEIAPALGHNYQENVTNPSCTEAGYSTFTCSNCGDNYTKEGEAALGHEAGAAATCTTAQTCIRCDHIFQAALGHEFVDGFCSRPECGISDGHTCDEYYEAVVTAPTCTADGYTTYTCSVCKANYTEAGEAALGHDFTNACDTDCNRKGCTYTRNITHAYEAVVTAPTCTAAGYTTYTCSVCGDNYTLAGEAALGHSWVDATCTAPKTCSVCDATEGDALGHDIVIDEAKNPTCTETGLTAGQHCSRCSDKTIAQNIVDALGHEAGAAATCETAQTCTRCDYVFQAALGHEAGAAATCETAQTCIRCDHVFQAALGHEAGAAATCETAQTCTRCDYVFQAALGHEAGAAATCTAPQICTVCKVELAPALGHTAGAAATCTAPQVCTVCNEVLVAALGHTAGAAATCTTAQVCTVCNEVLVAALGHSYQANVTAPTCTAKGYTTYTCACGDTYTADEVAANGHTAGAEATCTTAQICTVCNEVLVAALGHSYQANVTAPTCTAKGYTTYTCACGDTYTADEVAANGHTAGADATCTTAQICTVCQAELVAAYGHIWDDATCEKPRICSTCGATTGTALGHTWVDATCTTPKTCSTCQGTEGTALGHKAGAEATCTTAQICTVCQEVLVAALGHTWVDASCLTPKTCSTCNITEGDALGHKWKAATCTTPKTCPACGATEGEAVGHKWGPATCETPKTCAECEITEGNPNGHSGNDVGVCTVCAKNLVISVDEAIDIGLSKDNGKYSSEYYYVKLTITESVNANGFTRAKVRNDLYFSIAGGYLSDSTGTTVKTGDTVIYKAKIGASSSNMVVSGGREPRLYEVASYKVVSNCSTHDYSNIGVCNTCGHNCVISVEDAIAIGMTYENTKYTNDYYYVQLTLDHQVNSNGFARMTVSEGLYVTVAGGYLTGAAEGTIKLGNTVIFKAKLGASSSALTTGGKELRLYQVATYQIVSQQHTHVYGDTVTPLIPVTCGKDGTGTVACACGKTKEVVVPATKLHTPDANFKCTVCGKSAILTVDEAIAIGMSYDKTKYSSDYYYVQLTLDHQVNPTGGFARATIAQGLYVTVNAFLGSNTTPYQLGDTVIFKAKLGAANSALTTGEKELRLYEVAEYVISNPSVSTTVDGKTNIVTHNSIFSSFAEVTQAPAGVSFDLGYLYVKNSGLVSLANTALVWNTNKTYKTITFDLYVDKITDQNGNACNEVEFQLSAGIAFASIVDANGNEVQVKYGDAPYVVLQQGQSYHVVVDVRDVNTPAFSFGLNKQTCEVYFYNCSISTTSIDQVTITFVSGEKGGNAPLATLTGKIGDAIVFPANPTYPGFLFAGWYTDAACTTPFEATTYTSNLVVYAKWNIDPEQSLPVMSFNVKTSNSNKSLVIDVIRANNPYVFGVQEADSSWMSYLKSQLGSTYSCVGVERGGGIFNGGSEHSAIFYRTDMFDLVEGGTKWLSQTPDVASKYSDGTNTANYNRIMTYVVLERKSDGARFIYVNTHLDNNGNNDGTAAENVRKGQVEILLQQVQVLYNKYGNLPTVVSGDFNTQGVNNTASYKAMINGGFTDSSKVAVEADNKRTFNGNADTGNVIFDYIFVSADWADDVETYKVCEEKSGDKWISDHNAIISTIIFPTK